MCLRILRRARYTHHVERVGNQRQRVHRISGNQLDEEESRVDGEQYHDARGFGEPHVGGIGASFALHWGNGLTARGVRSRLRGLMYDGGSG